MPPKPGKTSVDNTSAKPESLTCENTGLVFGPVTASTKLIAHMSCINSLTLMLYKMLQSLAQALPDSQLLRFSTWTQTIAYLIDHNESLRGINDLLLRAADTQLLDLRLNSIQHQFLILVALTQKTMCRPQNKERGDMPDPEAFSQNRQLLLSYFGNLGLTQALKPELEGVTRVVMSGGFGFRMWRRMEYFVACLKESKISAQFVLCVATGDRKLDKKRDIESLKGKIPDEFLQAISEDPLANETTLAKEIVSFFAKNNSSLFEKITINYIQANAKPGDYRARTDDTAESLRAQQEEKITPKTVIVSDAPYIHYQVEDFRLRLSENKQDDSLIIGMGAAADPNYPIYDFYDAFSRLLFATAKRELCRNLSISALDAQKIIDAYKKVFTCESLLTKYQQTITEQERTVVQPQPTTVQEHASKLIVS